MIKPVITSSEVKITAQLAHRIWNQHYVPIIGQAQVDYMVEKFQSETAITEQIKNGYDYFLIDYLGTPSGYLALVANTSEKKLMISKIYVDAAHRGQNLGCLLLDFAIQQAKNHNLTTLWLTVNKDNSNTIQWYKKHGFKIKEKIVMDIGNGFVMDDYVLEMIVD